MSEQIFAVGIYSERSTDTSLSEFIKISDQASYALFRARFYLD